jgi:hypothetical protein
MRYAEFTRCHQGSVGCYPVTEDACCIVGELNNQRDYPTVAPICRWGKSPMRHGKVKTPVWGRQLICWRAFIARRNDNSADRLAFVLANVCPRRPNYDNFDG